MKTIIVEMEDPSSELLQSFKQGAEMRSFAAVSVALLPDEVPKESDHEAYQMRPAELEAINFLNVKMKDDPAFYRGGRYTDGNFCSSTCAPGEISAYRHSGGRLDERAST